MTIHSTSVARQGLAITSNAPSRIASRNSSQSAVEEITTILVFGLLALEGVEQIVAIPVGEKTVAENQTHPLRSDDFFAFADGRGGQRIYSKFSQDIR